MKTLVFLGVCCLLGLAACYKSADEQITIKNFKKDGIPVKSVSIQNDTVNLLVEYAGAVKFNDDHSAIASITPGGYLKYRNADKELFAENEDGIINLELADGGREVRTMEQKKRLFKEAYQAILHTDSVWSRQVQPKQSSKASLF